MHHILRRLPEGRQMEYDAKEDEKSRVLRLIEERKRTLWRKRQTESERYKRSGSREADEDRILYECMHEELEELAKDVRRG